MILDNRESAFSSSFRDCLLPRDFGHQGLQLLGLLVFLALFDLDGLPHQVSHSLLLRGIDHLATGTGWAHRTSACLENTQINCTYNTGDGLAN